MPLPRIPCIAPTNGQRFEAYGLPGGMEGLFVTGYLGMLSGGVALVACGSDVYAVTLP